MALLPANYFGQVGGMAGPRTNGRRKFGQISFIFGIICLIYINSQLQPAPAIFHLTNTPGGPAVGGEGGHLIFLNSATIGKSYRKMRAVAEILLLRIRLHASVLQ